MHAATFSEPAGGLLQVQEGDFLEVVTSEPRVVCHFFHRDFERCKILDRHLSVLSRKFFDTRFIKLSAPVRSESSGPSGNAAWPCLVNFLIW